MPTSSTLDHPVVLALVGLLVGNVIGLTGLGGGAVVVLLLVLLYGLDQKAAQGTSLSIILSPLQVPAMINYHRAGAIRWNFMLAMCPGILLGTFTGSYLAARLSPATLKVTFGLLMVYFGAYSVFSYGGGLAGVRRGVVAGLIASAAVGVGFGVARWQQAPSPPATTPSS